MQAQCHVALGDGPGESSGPGWIDEHLVSQQDCQVMIGVHLLTTVPSLSA